MGNLCKQLVILLVVGFLGTSWTGVLKAQSKSQTYREAYRPQYHFSPAQNWMNDPNGLVYHDGEYHLFYQYNPFGNTWGHMSWGHAVSTDLVHWKHLPVALKEEDGVMIFSGSAILDKYNTSGFGSKENPAMVAIYTGNYTNKPLQDQRIAYSLDNGRSWSKYKGNPVVEEGLENFRDPKVFWHESSHQWVMVTVLATQYKVRFYGSKNLKDWKELSEFGPAGGTEGVWECPDLFRLPVNGDSTDTKWVLQVDLNPGGPFGGSGAQYFIGEFDGEKFVQDPATEGETRWVDYGKDFYAVQSYNNIPPDDGRRIWLGWMNNWQYAQEIPTHPWRSAMTIPRSLELRSFNDGIFLTQQPVRELQTLRGKHYQTGRQSIGDSLDLLSKADVKSKTIEIKARFKLKDGQNFGFKLARGLDEETIVGYDAIKNKLYVDRRNSGESSFNKDFAGIYKAPLAPQEGIISMHIFLDKSSIEVLGNDGRVVLTNRIFPSDGNTGLSLFAKGGAAELLSLDVWQLHSIWSSQKNKMD